MNSTILPRIPSQLIRLALADLRKVEKDPTYFPNMGVWHSLDGAVCEVCLAGSVIAKTLEADLAEIWYPEDLPENNAQLVALDFFRQGLVIGALDRLGHQRPHSIPLNWEVPFYHVDREDFHSSLEALAANLEAAGL